jgi:GTPase SAR1 family protein
MSNILKKAANLLPKVTRELAGAKPVDMMGDYRKNYKFKARFGLLGPVSAGKSTLCAAIVETCEDQSAIDATFYARVLPSSSNILRDANRLRKGHFPEKTDPTAPQAPEAGLLISKKGMIKDNGVHVPICDVAGEVSDYLCATGGGCGSPSERIRARDSGIAHAVIDTVRDCQGFIIALDANDSLLLGDDEQDNDSYMHDVLTNIFEWRRRNGKPDPHIILVLTKWDVVMSKAKDLGMDAYDGENGLQRFLDNGFPAMSMLLKPLRDKGMVKFFRSWFKIATDPEGKPIYWEGTGKPKIDIIEKENAYIRFKPNFSQPDYTDLIDHIVSFG